jgi:hypothetical protein
MNGTLSERALRGAFVLAMLLQLGGNTSRADTETSVEKDPPDDLSSAGEKDSDAGLVARFGTVTASFRFFGDFEVLYDSPAQPETGKTNFVAGSFDSFSSVRLDDHFRICSEIVAEFDSSNEIAFELERLWALWSKNDAFYLKVGREHSPVSRWNQLYHHGQIFWPSITKPMIARFEDDDGVLPIHYAGVEVGGTLRSRIGAFTYTAVISNGRGLVPTEVTNVRDYNNQKALDVAWAYSPSMTRAALAVGFDYHHDLIPANPAAGPAATSADESIGTVFAQLRAGPFEGLAEFAAIHHEEDATGAKYQHRSWYVQANVRFNRVEPYARFEDRSMAEGDPFYMDEGADLDGWGWLLGLRVDIGEHGAFKMEGGTGRAETRDATGALVDTNVTFGAVGLQWMF